MSIKIFYPSPETWKNIQFELIKISSLFSNWRMSNIPKIPVQIDRRNDFGNKSFFLNFVKILKSTLWKCTIFVQKLIFDENKVGSLL